MEEQEVTQTSGKLGSIYSAQAAEIQNQTEAETLAFQYVGLTNWPDVARKVLMTEGCRPKCM